MIGVTDYSQIGEEIGSKEPASIGVYWWYLVVIPEGNMLGLIEGSAE